MNSCLGACLAAGALPMPDILPIRLRPLVVRLFRDREARILNHLILILPVSRAARGRAPVGRSDKQPGLTGRNAGRWLLIGCKLAAPKTKNPRICATNRETLLQIRCRFSKRARPSQGFRGFPPAAIRCRQQEQPGAKFALRRRCLLLDFASTAAPGGSPDEASALWPGGPGKARPR